VVVVVVYDDHEDCIDVDDVTAGEHIQTRRVSSEGEREEQR
jgi:hypothetical protein